LAEASTVDNPADQSAADERASAGNTSIEVKGVSKFFGSLTAVNNLSFVVKKGEIVGFLGPNGSGKTTTMRMLTSFYTPDAGEIKIDGIDTQENDLRTRFSIGYLPENNPFYADLMVSEYLNFIADLRGLSKEERKQNIPPTVDETGLSEVYYRPIGQLSKGYKQRVGLAQAILHRPSILILDEPTEGLDPNQRLTIRDLIKSLGQERTVMISTHVMQEVETTCERVLVISRGDLVADSPVSDLLLKAQGVRTVHIEVEGNEIERALERVPNVDSIQREDRLDGHKRYVISTQANEDLRPAIFNLAKRNDWVLYELREERARMEDVFHDLTVDRQNESQAES
jgi:ABC-2 type transport system ATP-binding protein